LSTILSFKTTETKEKVEFIIEIYKKMKEKYINKLFDTEETRVSKNDKTT